MCEVKIIKREMRKMSGDVWRKRTNNFHEESRRLNTFIAA